MVMILRKGFIVLFFFFYTESSREMIQINTEILNIVIQTRNRLTTPCTTTQQSANSGQLTNQRSGGLLP
uniref:Secreted protein n=1 Tax=Romanomermis culicivorax TaxID=13658 RepID=A0A915K938_ROMCU